MSGEEIGCPYRSECPVYINKYSCSHVRITSTRACDLLSIKNLNAGTCPVYDLLRERERDGLDSVELLGSLEQEANFLNSRKIGH